ncbi:MAG: hypothetical protein ACRDOO_16190 [Actinomadura sp.]
MTAVVVLGDIPTAGIIRQASADRVRVDSSLGSAAALEFVTQAAEGLRERTAVLALYPAWRSVEASRFVQLARAMLDSDRIAGVPLDLPPLAFSLVADQLAYLAEHVSPGLLASLAHRLPMEVFSGAWVNSVAKLEHVQTGLGKHMASYMPGTGFMVSAAPHQSVHRITSARPVAQLTFRPADPVLMLTAHEEGGTDWLEQTLAPAIGPQSLTPVVAQPLSSTYWGTKKYAEFVAFSGHPHALPYAIHATPCRPCPWCKEPTALPTCPFCLMVQPITHAAPAQPQTAPVQAAPPQPTAPAPRATPQPVQPEPSAYRPQPASERPTKSWYGEETQRSRDVPPPSASENRQESRHDDSGDRHQTITFAVPHLEQQEKWENGAHASAVPVDPTRAVTASTSNGASAQRDEADASDAPPESTPAQEPENSRNEVR